MPYVYATKDTVLTYHDARLVVQLTNDNDEIDPDQISAINETVLTQIENAAARIIDNYFRNVYDNLPLTGPSLTEEVEEIAAHLTWCLLWERRGEEPDQVGKLRDRVIERLEEMVKSDAAEVRGQRSTSAYAVRSRTGKVRTMFDAAGYFDGIQAPGIPGTRKLSGDTENDRNG